jgi:hypothetical protein
MPYPTKASTPSEADLAINQILLTHAELQKNLKRFLGPVTATNTEPVGADGRDEDQGNVADGGSDDEFVAEDETYVSILLLAPSCLLRSLGENLRSYTFNYRFHYHGFLNCYRQDNSYSTLTIHKCRAGLTMALSNTSAASAVTQAFRQDEKLRRQLLGKRARAVKTRGRFDDQIPKVPKSRPVKLQARGDSGEDSDEGRSSLGGKRRREAMLTGEQLRTGDAVLNTKEQVMSTPSDGKDGASAPGGRKKGPSSYLDKILAERATKKKKNRKRQAVD